jgi:hypothetical protein
MQRGSFGLFSLVSNTDRFFSTLLACLQNQNYLVKEVDSLPQPVLLPVLPACGSSGRPGRLAGRFRSHSPRVLVPPPWQRGRLLCQLWRGLHLPATGGEGQLGSSPTAVSQVQESIPGTESGVE